MFSKFAGRTMPAALVLLGVAAVAYAQNFPTRPVRLLSTEPGASSDVAARIIAQGLTTRLGQQVIVDNRGGVIAIEALMRASPDGHTLLIYGPGLWIAPLMQRTTYDPIKDLAPVAVATSSPAVLVVHPSVAAKSVKDLIALARSRPAELNYGSGGAGSTPHLAAELFKSMAGVKITRVAFKGTGPAMNSVIGGEVQILFATAPTVGPHVKTGKLRALGVTSARPTPLVPDLPTIAAVLPGYEMTQTQGIFAPAKTPPALVNRIQQDIAAVVAQPEVKERFLSIGAEAVGGTSAALAQTMKSEMARLGKVLKEEGIKLE